MSNLGLGKDVPSTEEVLFGWLPPEPYDIALRRILQDPTSPMYWDRIGASLVWPPLGMSCTSCPPTEVITSPDRWDAAWMSPGTRMYTVRNGACAKPSTKQRWITGFRPWVDAPTWSGIYINLPEDLEELRWRNSPPLPSGPPEERQRRGYPAGRSTEADSYLLQGGKVTTWKHGKGTTLKKIRQRLEQFRMKSRDPIPEGCKSLPKEIDGRVVRYDGQALTEEEMDRPDKGSVEQLKSLFQVVFYFQPRDDMAALAYKISMDQGTHDYDEEQKRNAAMNIYDEFMKDMKKDLHSEKIARDLGRVRPRMLCPYDSLFF